jgi:hypothetical protein
MNESISPSNINELHSNPTSTNLSIITTTNDATESGKLN